MGGGTSKDTARKVAPVVVPPQKTATPVTTCVVHQKNTNHLCSGDHLGDEEIYANQGAPAAIVSTAAPSPSLPATTVAPKLLGKEKYVKEYGALAMDDRVQSTSVGTLFFFCEAQTERTVFSYRDNCTGSVFARTFTDAELGEAKQAAKVGFSWAPFFKSIATAMIKSKAIVTTITPTRKDVTFTIFNSKDTSRTFPFTVMMEVVSEGLAPKPKAVFDFAMYPLTRAMQYNRSRAATTEREECAARVECESAVVAAAVKAHTSHVEKLLPTVRPLREESALQSQNAMLEGREVRNLERRLKAREGHTIMKHPLDQLYDEGGAQPFQHTVWSPEHIPQGEEPDEVLSDCIRAAFPLGPDMELSDISCVLQRPEIQRQVEASGNQKVISEAFEIFKGIDRWDYDTIQLEIITDGNALFYTTYLLLYKLDLVRYFNLDDAVLRRFLVAVQSSYHPNPYHNAMHGADVTQINYYIMIVAGLATKCRLSKEELFAGLIAGAVHDFDHPGLNNNFHSRTGAYLATLYNDRSILESHHLACTFELVRHPRYNIFATLSDEQRLVVRETMIEMVLATDMGNHAKIFKNFQVRMSETSDWFSKKDDVRLALSMSIKMADISNCARPNHIYAEWAKNISKEFYLQGDAERKLNLSVSPFMDRTKEAEEFPKGQISFIMYIVQPMVEAISALLPSMSFAVGLCADNKEYWKRIAEETQ
jgi:hypothetical protein